MTESVASRRPGERRRGARFAVLLAVAGLILADLAVPAATLARDPLAPGAGGRLLPDPVVIDPGAPADAPDDAAAPSQSLGRAVERSHRFLVRWEGSPAPDSVARGTTLQAVTLARRARTPERITALRGSGAPAPSFVRLSASGAAIYDAGAALGPDAVALLERIAAIPGVVSVEPDPWLTAAALPSDEFSGDLWAFIGVNPYGTDVLGAWDAATAAAVPAHGEGVVIAVLDTGITAHPDLDGQTVEGYDFIDDPETANDGDPPNAIGSRDGDPSDPGDWCDQDFSTWHGSHVTGTIVGTADNSIGVFGGAPGARVMPVRVLGRCGGYVSDVAAAIRWVVSQPGDGLAVAPPVVRPRIINMSLGGESSCESEMRSAIALARARDTLVVVAAGNEGVNAALSSPANCPGVFTVAASDRNGRRAEFHGFGSSNYGSIVDIAAPGREILSTVNAGTRGPSTPTYAGYEGTSMATPIVVSTAALLFGARPTLTSAEVASVIRATATTFATNVAHPCTTATCGAGIANAERAMQALLSEASPPTGTAVFEDGGTTATTSKTGQVVLALAATDAETGVAEVEVSVDGSTWRRQDNASRVGVDVTAAAVGGTPAPGPRTIHVRWVNGAGLTSAEQQLTLDYLAAPAASMTALPALSITRSLALAWSAAVRAPGETVTGIDVAYRRAPWDGTFGPWETLAANTQRTNQTVVAHLGMTYCFRVRARDSRGTESAWSAATCTGVPLDERRLARTGTWSAGQRASYVRATYLTTRSRSASLGRRGVRASLVGVIARTCPTCGSIEVLWDGTFMRRISLRSPVTTRRLFTVISFGETRVGPLRIRVVSSGRPVRIDGIVVRRN